jgi:t-SNARE complex subunit (syntaxin)
MKNNKGGKMRHKGIKKIEEILAEMTEDFDEKIDMLDEDEKREEYYNDILFKIDEVLDEIKELKEIKLTDY